MIAALLGAAVATVFWVGLLRHLSRGWEDRQTQAATALASVTRQLRIMADTAGANYALAVQWQERCAEATRRAPLGPPHRHRTPSPAHPATLDALLGPVVEEGEP